MLPIVVSATRMVFKFSLHGIEDLPIPAGYFVLISNEVEGLPWHVAGNTQQTYRVIVGRIQDIGNLPNQPYMDFYLLTNEYLRNGQNTIESRTLSVEVL